MQDLTDRQRAVLDFIVGYIDDEGYPPTIRDMCRYFGINSPNGVVCHLVPLEKKGYIERRPNFWRGIRVTECVTTGEQRRSKGELKRLRAVLESENRSRVLYSPDWNRATEWLNALDWFMGLDFPALVPTADGMRRAESIDKMLPVEPPDCEATQSPIPNP